MDENDLLGIRKTVFAGNSRDHFLHLGYFNSTYSIAEFWLTFLLAIQCGLAHDLRAFEDLTRGMDAKTKALRLRGMLKRRNQLGPVFENRLDFFICDIVNLRNKLAHMFLTRMDNDADNHLIYMASISKVRQQKPDVHADTADPLSTMALFEHAYWLNLFEDDLRSLLQIPRQQTVEIDSPRSYSPMVYPRSQLP